ncbi:unnamed protein product [Oppiella nova]|uniref:F-box domain-containing protein n=1 Tax=Oppiella nova TaxID=334625 RepID=A0A7R9MHN9_9ACAR|nr:unnamed protein product [Oppiella nova]CAG2177576.1 unnamed protein product [Oppiella nova]
MDDADCDLITRFLRLNSDEFGNVFICSPKQTTSRTHFSCLPFEVVLNILKWIVSNELDLRSLEQFGSVCRGFYIASRDQELWRLSCYKTWDSHSSAALIANYGNNWRHMFVERVRPNFNGAYISRTTYIRQGEASFQDVHYRPCYLVEYYRYIRFFPNGHVLMLTTADDPHQSLPSLRHRKPKNSNVLSGHYRINGQTISIVIKRDYISDGSQTARKYKHKNRDQSVSTQTFNISLDVKTVRNRRNHQLLWSHYSVHYRKPNGQEMVTDFDLTANKFPSFWFSRVKSYVTTADHKLA